MLHQCKTQSRQYKMNEIRSSCLLCKLAKKTKKLSILFSWLTKMSSEILTLFGNETFMLSLWQDETLNTHENICWLYSSFLFIPQTADLKHITSNRLPKDKYITKLINLARCVWGTPQSNANRFQNIHTKHFIYTKTRLWWCFV